MSSAVTPSRNQLAEIDLLDLDMFERRVPFEWFDVLRRERPVAWHDEPAPNHGFWAVSRYDDLVTVHLDPGTYSAEVGAVALEEPDPSQLRIRRTMLETDPPAHRALRNITAKRFARGGLERDMPTFRRIAREVVDRALAQAEFDLMTDVARELTVRCLGVVLGVPQDDALRVGRWADALIQEKLEPEQAFEGRPERLITRSATAYEVFRYAHRKKVERLAEPRHDVLTALAVAEDRGALDPLASHNYLSLLLIAGNETTRHTIAHSVLALMDHPDQAERLGRDPSLWPTAIEEFLRWSTPLLHFRRTATRDTTLGGQRIRAGDKVVTWYISANRDETRFPDPYRFDIARRPNHHVAFGPGGVHFCLGAHLARLEIRVLFDELLPRLSAIELVGEVERIRSNFVNGFEHVRVRAHAR